MRRLMPLVAVVLVGCASGGGGEVTADEEKMFKNPPPVDRSKVPANAFEHKGPSFIGEPSKGSGGAAPSGVSGG